MFAPCGTTSQKARPGSPYPVGPEPGGVTLADLDGDGRDDLVAAAGGEGSIAIMLVPGGP